MEQETTIVHHYYEHRLQVWGAVSKSSHKGFSSIDYSALVQLTTSNRVLLTLTISEGSKKATFEFIIFHGDISLISQIFLPNSNAAHQGETISVTPFKTSRVVFY